MSSYTLPNVSFPYYKFSISGMDLVHSFKGGQGERPDYFAGLVHTRYSDKANTAVVNLTYVPTGNDDPNKIEKALADSGGKCTYQYGVAGYRSKTYRGLIYDYSPSFSEGVLQYTLSIVSKAATYNFVTIQDESLSIKALGDREVSKSAVSTGHIPSLSESARSMIEDIYEGPSGDPWDYYFKKQQLEGIDPEILSKMEAESKQQSINFKDPFGSYKQLPTKVEVVTETKKLTRTSSYTDKTIVPVFEAKPLDKVGEPAKEEYSIGPNEIFDIMEKIVKNYMGDFYEFDRADSDSNFSIGPGAVSTKGLSPVVALKKIAKNLVDNDEEFKYFYKIDISDSVEEGPKGKIRLKRTSQKVSASYTFNWGGRDSNVLSWNPKYSGSVAIFNESPLSYATTMDQEINPDRGVISTTMKIYEKPPAKDIRNEAERQLDNTNWNDDTLYSNTIENINWFHEKVNYCYTATLEVLGVPDDLEITSSIVQVNPLINGKLHHSSGSYMVIGIEDRVDSQGFVTKLELAKITSTKDGSLMYQAPDGKYKVRTITDKEDGTHETKTYDLVDYVPKS